MCSTWTTPIPRLHHEGFITVGCDGIDHGAHPIGTSVMASSTGQSYYQFVLHATAHLPLAIATKASWSGLVSQQHMSQYTVGKVAHRCTVPFPSRLSPPESSTSQSSCWHGFSSRTGTNTRLHMSLEERTRFTTSKYAKETGKLTFFGSCSS